MVLGRGGGGGVVGKEMGRTCTVPIKEEGFFYCPYMWAVDVVGMTKNLELYRTLVGISTVEPLHGGDPWICNSGAIFSELELCQTRP
jgi:hypothetical protein